MKRFFGFVFFLVLLAVFVFPQYVSADDLMAYAEPGYSGDEKTVFAPQSSDEIKAYELGSHLSGYGGDVIRRRGVRNGEVTTIRGYLKDDSSAHIDGYAEMGFILDGVSSYYKTLALGIEIESKEFRKYPVEIFLISEEKELYTRLEVGSGSWSRVVLDISGISAEEMEIIIRVLYDHEYMPESMGLTAPYLMTDTTKGFTFANKYLTNKYESVVGSFSMTSENIRPSEHKAVTIVGDLVMKNMPAEGDDAVLEIVLSGINDGTLSLGILYEGMTEEQRVFSKRISLSAGDGTYAIPIDVDGRISSYSLSFTNVNCVGFFKIDSIRLYSREGLSADSNPDIGSVNSIKLVGRTVSFRGTMERSVVSAFSNMEIGFYAIAGNESHDLSKAIELGRINTTTRFEYSVDLSRNVTLVDTYMFFAALVTGDGDMLLLSTPKYCDAGAIHSSDLSNMGLYNASVAGSFEANVSHVILDLDIYKLITEADSFDSTIVTYTVLRDSFETRSVGIDMSVLRQLDRDIEFYTSIGVKTYIRLICSKEIKGLTYGGKAQNYGIRALDENARGIYTAVVRAIAERYPGASGFVVGSAVNAYLDVGEAGIYDVASYAKCVAELCRITYNAAREYCGDGVAIVVPMAEYSANKNQVKDRTLGVAISDYLSRVGTIPWVFMYSIDNVSDKLDSPDYLSSILSDLEISGFNALMYFYDPKNDNLKYKYSNYLDGLYQQVDVTDVPDFGSYVAITFGELCARCEEHRARAVFLSIGDILSTTDHAFYSTLKDIGVENADRYIYDYETVILKDYSEDSVGSFVLWDFSDKHHTLGWISGGGIESLRTDHSPLFSEDSGKYSRVLKSVVNTSGDARAAALILRNLQGTTDLSGDLKLVFEFSITGASESRDFDELTVVFFAGAEDYRAEFNTSRAKYGEIQRLVCDLSDYEHASAVEFIGAMVYCEDSIDFDLSKVYLLSESQSSEELAARFAGDFVDPKEPRSFSLILIFVIMISVVTIIACVLFIRRDREDDEQRRTVKERGIRKNYER